MAALKNTIDGLIKARHRLITDSALEMNRMMEYVSYSNDEHNDSVSVLFKLMASSFTFKFNNDNYIDSYMVDVTLNDNDLYQLIASNYDLFLSLTKEVKKVKHAMFESFLIFWDSFIGNVYGTTDYTKLGKYMIAKCDSLFIIRRFVARTYVSSMIPNDIIHLIDKFYKSFEFHKCNPLLNFELNPTNPLQFHHKFMYNGVIVIGHLWRTCRREAFKLSFGINGKVKDSTFGIGFIAPKYDWKLPTQTGTNNDCMFLFGNGNYVSSPQFNVFCKRTKWKDDLSLFQSNGDTDKDTIITMEVDMRCKIAKIYNIDKCIVWCVKIPNTIAVAIYVNDAPKQHCDRIYSNSNKGVVTIMDQQYNVACE
eukprot:51000_1